MFPACAIVRGMCSRISLSMPWRDNARTLDSIHNHRFMIIIVANLLCQSYDSVVFISPYAGRCSYTMP